ncbi:hypothetical protein [Bdellovibrio sp. HCB337]|uniref:hypothetical protein n=1 Tax=Bdellovibrio sp. HCB337 TaxID=3394358 RepID=UPI0039A53AB7
MPTSKLLFWTFLVLSLSGLTACNIPTPQAREGSDETAAATFFVTEIKGDAVASNLNKDYAIPKSKTFNFSACLKDQAQSKPLIGHPFRIEEINKELKTDEKGCLNWMEEVPFNYFATPTYIEWKRKITATGLHKGSRVAQFAINPWNDTDKSQAVVNLSNTTPTRLATGDEDVKAALSGEDKKEDAQEIKSKLWVNEMRVQSTQEQFTKDGVILNMELMAAPQLQIQAMNGETVLRPISQGRFKTKVYLIHSIVENGVEKNRVLAESSVELSDVRNGNLFIKSPLKLTTKPAFGQLVLGLDITAESANENIGNFQGAYMIGEHDQLKGASFLRLMKVVTQKPGFKLADFINSKLEDKQAENSDTKEGYVKARIEVSPLEISFLRVAKENTSEREIIYNVKACFKNGLDEKITRGYSFKVQGFRQQGQAGKEISKLNADNMGCVNWDEIIKFKYYECHKSLIGNIDIENKDLAIKESIRVAINPWDIGAKGRDLRFPYSEEHVITDCKKENVLPSTLSLRSFNYSTLSYSYDIDKYLNLSVKKKLRFKLDAVVSVFSDMATGRMEGAQKIRPGVYLLKMALIKNRDYYSQKTYIASTEKLVSTLDGDIKADIEFKTSDLKALGNRNTLLVELDPVQESKVIVDKNGEVTPKNKVASLDEVIDSSTGLYNRTFSAAMILNSDRDSADLAPITLKEANEFLTAEKLPVVEVNKSVVREYIKFGEQARKEQTEVLKAQSDMDLFAKKNSLQVVRANRVPQAPDLRAILLQAPTKLTDAQITKELHAFATTGKLNTTLTRGLCAYWFRSYINKDLWDWNVTGQRALINCGIRAKNPEKLFTVEKRLFVKDIGGFKHLKGYNAGISVGNNISLSKSFTNSSYVTKSLGFNSGLSYKFAEIFSIGVTASYSIAQSEATAVSTANSTSVTTNISPVMQQNIYQLQFNRYQECSIVKINPALFMKKGLYEGAINPAYTDDKKVDVATRGLMVCTGEDNTKTIMRNESYYLLAQETSSTNMQDFGNEVNRNFFIALRGEKEFDRLMYFMKGVIKTPTASDRDHNDQKNVVNGLDVLFNSGSANIPGSYNDTRP